MEEIYRREIGFSQPRTFFRRVFASEALVKQIDLYGTLNGHEGCVNTIQFNSSGDILVSGSDDQKVMMWDWATLAFQFSYDSGHLDNIFQVKIMPFTDDRRIVTSSADGQVRLGELLESSEVRTKRIGRHQGRVHNLAVEPGSAYNLYSCGEDGFVQHFDLRSNSARKLFCCSPLANNKNASTSVGLNALVIDPRNPHYFAVGGSDEYARVYDIRKYHLDPSSKSDAPVNTFCPKHLFESQDVNITSLAYSNSSELLVSYNDELIYLFQKNMGMGPSPSSCPHEVLQKLEDPQVYSGHRNSQTIKGVSFFGPSDEYVMSGSDCGHIFIWKKKGANLVRVMVGDRSIVNQLESHPHTSVIASSGIEKSIKLWAPSSNDVLPLPHNIQEIMDHNRQNREDHTCVTLTPDVIMHVLRLHRRQAMANLGRGQNRDDADSDDEGDGAYILRLSGDDEVHPNECNIS